jgi:hypothetical protein
MKHFKCTFNYCKLQTLEWKLKGKKKDSQAHSKESEYQLFYLLFV